MEIRRETDAILANRISNDPGVFVAGNPYAGQHVDWSPIVEKCVILSNGEDGIQVYEMKAPRVWEVVTVYGPTCRGRRALQTAYAMRDWMLPHTDVAFGSVPDALPQAQWFYRKIGGVPVHAVETDDAIYTANPGGTLFEFRSDRWH